MKDALPKPLRILKEHSQRLRHRYFDDFIFIHINKTGGSSVEKALRLPLEHKTALEKIEEIGREQWEKKFSFAVVRNPWDKVVSHFHYRVQRNRTGLAVNRIDFKDWVRLAYGEQAAPYYDNPKMFMPQLDWICDQKGEVLVDMICRFESLASDFEKVCKRIGRKASLPHVKSSSRRGYREYYDDETAQIVRGRFRKDIEAFGYEF
jgi:chondroitin 4-sulfotransferase 11